MVGWILKKFQMILLKFGQKLLKDLQNAAGVTHGGYIMSVLDSGMGTAAHQVIDGIAVTITLDIKFISGSKAGEEIIGYAKIKRKKISYFYAG